MNTIEQLMVEGYQIVGKHTKIRVIATYPPDGLIFQVYKNKRVLLYQGSDYDRVRAVFLESEKDR